MNRISLLLAAGIAAGHADVVSWNYDRFGTVNDTRVAGVEAVANWNNSWPANPTVDLIDDSGAATTVDLAYTSFNTWSVNNPASNPGQDADGSYNRELLNGYLNAGNAEWGPAITSSSVTLTQIPYPDYRIIVYFSSDAAGREGDVTDGTTTFSFQTVGPPSVGGSDAVLAETTDTEGSYATAANYAVFNGLSGSTQTITVQMRDNDEWGGIAGFQIVAELGNLPEFGLQPVDQSAAVDSTATITAAASSDPAPTYRWEYSADGVSGWSEMEGETAATLEIPGVQLSDSGYYRVIADNGAGSATSDIAFLDVFYGAPEFYEQPAGTVAVVGSDVSFSADAYTYGSPSYQWYKDNEPIPGETDFILDLANVGPGDEGEYFLRVTDDIEPGLFADSEIATLATFAEWDGLVSHEPFDPAGGYATGELPLQDPAVEGYTGPWTDINFGDAEPEVQTGSLVYGNAAYLGSSGDRAGKSEDVAAIEPGNSGRVFRLLEPALVVAPNTTGVRYLSFLYRNGNQNAAANPVTYSTLALYSSDTADANRNFEAGVADDALGANLFYRVNNSTVGDMGAPLDSNVRLLVVKFDLSDELFSDSVTMWVDPPLGSREPEGGVTVSGSDIVFDRLVLSDYASNSSAWDEIRWGSSFDSVTFDPNAPTDTYAAWISGYDVGGLTGFGEDADNDGIANGIENFFGSAPDMPNPGIDQVTSDGGTVTFRHPQNATPASDIGAAYRWSTDLAGWNADGASAGGTSVSFSAISDTPVAGTTTVTATITGAVPEKLFIDIEVTQEAP